MNASNPFQIPPCLQRADLQRRRRERFRNGFLAALSAHVVLFVVLLIQGCKSGQSAFITPLDGAPAVTAIEENSTPAAIASRPVAVLPVNTVAAAPVSPAVKETAPAAASQPESLYVVKPGDTLTRIAKTHSSTIKAIKTANNLSDDRLAVGTKLKIPAV